MLPHVVYEPEQFPGAMYYPDEVQGAAVLIFANGKMVVAGLKRSELLEVLEQVVAKLGKMIPMMKDEKGT